MLINKIRSYTSLAVNQTQTELEMNPWFLTGFSDGEACFLINIFKSSKPKAGWGARATFELGLDQKDLLILNRIKSYLGVGNITSKTNGSCVYSVQSVKDLAVIIDHFDKYPLITKKGADYFLFKMAVNLIKNKEHLTKEGLRKIVAIKASINKGLSNTLKEIFPDVKPVPKPLIADQEIKDPNWISGFVTGEGCFFIDIRKSSAYKIGYVVQLKFQVTQHFRDKALLENLIEYFGCGRYNQKGDDLNSRAGDFIVSNFSDIYEKIIPFLKKYPIEGVKALDFADFCEVAELIKTKEHLAEEGLKKIKEIKARMNKNRTNDSISSASKAIGTRKSTISLYFSSHQVKPYKGRYIFSRKLSSIAGNRFMSTKASANSKIFSIYSKNTKTSPINLLNNKIIYDKSLMVKHHPAIIQNGFKYKNINKIFNDWIMVGLIIALFLLEDSYIELGLLSIIPVKNYSNAETQKKEILKDNKKKSGVYRWINIENEKSYVGSSVNMGIRFKNYYSNYYLKTELKKSKCMIYKALLKYKYSNFTLEILEYCAPEDCIKREQSYIDLLKPEYNILKIAGSLQGFQHSKETLAKMAAIKLGKKNPMYGKKRVHSEETIAKISNANIGKKRDKGVSSLAQKITVSDISTIFQKIYMPSDKKFYSTKANANSKIFSIYSKYPKTHSANLINLNKNNKNNLPLTSKHFPASVK